MASRYDTKTVTTLSNRKCKLRMEIQHNEELGFRYHLLRSGKTAIWSGYFHCKEECLEMAQNSLLQEEERILSGLFNHTKKSVSAQKQEFNFCLPLVAQIQQPIRFKRR